jgi:hypothetical protein
LMDMSGRILQTETITGTDKLSTSLNVRRFKSGQYLLVVKTDHIQKIERITITH